MFLSLNLNIVALPIRMFKEHSKGFQLKAEILGKTVLAVHNLI